MSHDTPDPIDLLIPPPRPWWVRLAVAIVLIGIVGVGSFLWRQGYLRPMPDCCGSSGSTAMMSLSPDGKAVTVTALLYNGSGRQLRMDSAIADLPGATVREIRVFPGDAWQFPPTNAELLPVELAGGAPRWLVITFTPDTCIDAPGPWGSVTVHLEVLHGWLPSVGRDYTLPDAVVEPGQLSVFPPDDTFDSNRFTTPLSAACALLGRSS